jgi:Kae1-associated kinase Bud32
MILHDDRIYLIDFGLAFHDSSIESQGVDLHVFFQTLKSTQDEPLALIEAFKKGYFRIYSKADKVLNRESEIEARGRYL